MPDRPSSSTRHGKSGRVYGNRICMMFCLIRVSRAVPTVWLALHGKPGSKLKLAISGVQTAIVARHQW